MDYFARRNLYNNNRSPPILLNNISYNSNNISTTEYPRKHFSKIVPSYSGNPQILKSHKSSIFNSNNLFDINNTQPIHIRELIKSKNKNNDNINNSTNINPKYLYNYPKYPKYTESSNNIENESNNKSNYNYLYNEQTKNENRPLHYSSLRSKILNLSNGHPKKIITKNYSMDYIPIKKNYAPSPPKKKLILDLDETLVHSGFNPFTRQSDISLQINIDGRAHTINILKRPYVDEFLKEISNYYEIYVFTASMEEYASPVIDLIDKNNLVRGKFFRQDCIFNSGLYIKDLFKVTNDLRDVIIIDNNPSSYVTNEDNGIPIKTWYDDLNDNELIKLIPLLKYLSNVDDVRNIIRQIVDKRNNEIDFYIVDNIINGNNNYDSNNNINNKKYENNFYHEINDTKLRTFNNIIYEGENNNNNNEYDRYIKYNNINSFSNMSYNEIQNESEHTNNNNNINFNEYNYINNNEEIKYNPKNRIENFYFNENINVNNYINSIDFPREKTENNLQSSQYINNNNQMNQNINNENENEQNLFYERRIKNRRNFTPNINRRKINSFFNNDNYNKEMGKTIMANYQRNNLNLNNINEEKNILENYYKLNNDNKDNNNNYEYNNINDNNIRLNTLNTLNHSYSDIYINIPKNGNFKKYNNLLNINNNDKGRYTEANVKNKDYYLQSYQNHLSKNNYRIKEYNKNEYSNDIIKSRNKINLNNSNNLISANKSHNYFYRNKIRNNLNNFINDKNNLNSNITGNYTKKNIDNNKRDYIEELNQFKNQMNLRFKNFRDYIMEKKRDIFNEENKSRNFEEPEKYNDSIQSYGYKKYLINNNQRKYNFLLNNNNINQAQNYLERTNIQNLINDYRNKYNAFENSINKSTNNNKSSLKKSLSEDKIIFNSNNNFNRYLKLYNNNDN